MKTDPSKRRAGFTLIELLTVIGIIAILAALLFPAVKNVLRKAEVNQARGDVKNIEQAIKAFATEYGYLPTTDQADTWYGSGQVNAIYNVLRATGSSTTLNPRRIVFLETPSRKGAFDGSGHFVDPWGNPYCIKLDGNYDGEIEYFGTRRVAVVVVSFGPNGTQEDPTLGTSDDIVNFQ
jgi:prepilin-type N-terminal cleavage/methylation domain-containing protein